MGQLYILLDKMGLDETGLDEMAINRKIARDSQLLIKTILLRKLFVFMAVF